MNTSTETWIADWPQRLRSALTDLGFETISSFLNAYPGEPYVQVATRIAPWDAGTQVVRLHMQEARRNGTLRYAAMDSLARNLNWRLPQGWIPDGPTNSEAAGAAANTSTAVEIDGESPQFADQLFQTYRALKALTPPIGWRPAGPDDALIREAFARGWTVV